MGLDNSLPRCCNQVHLDTRLFGVVSVANPVSIHLGDFDGGDFMILKHVVDLHISALRDQLFV